MHAATQPLSLLCVAQDPSQGMVPLVIDGSSYLN